MEVKRTAQTHTLALACLWPLLISWVQLGKFSERNHGPGIDGVWDVALDNNTLFVATDKGMGILRKGESRFELVRSENGRSGQNNIRDILLRGGYLYGASWGGGIFIFDLEKKTKEILRRENYGLSSNTINALLFGNDDTFYVGTNYGLARHRTGESGFEILIENTDGPRGNYVWEMAMDETTGTLFVGTSVGRVLVLKEGEDRFEKWTAQSHGLGHSNVRALLLKDKNLFVGNEEGEVSRLDLRDKKGRFEIIASLGSAIEDMEMENNTLFVGTQRKGIFALEEGKEVVEVTASIRGFKRNTLRCITVHQGLLFVGTSSGGIIVLGKEKREAETLENEDHPFGRLDVRDLTFSEEGTLFGATYGGGISRWREGEGMMGSLTKESHGLPVDDVESVVTEEGILYGGTWGGGIAVLREESVGFEVLNRESHDLRSDFIQDMAVEGNLLAVASLGGGISILERKDQGFELLAHRLESQEVRTVAMGEGILYGGTWGNGVFVLKRGGERFEILNRDNSDLGSNFVTDILLDEGTLFVATYGGGVSVLKKGETRFGVLSRKSHGLSHDFVTSLDRGNGKLFVGRAGGWGGGVSVLNSEEREFWDLTGDSYGLSGHNKVRDIVTWGGHLFVATNRGMEIFREINE